MKSYTFAMTVVGFNDFSLRALLQKQLIVIFSVFYLKIELMRD